MTFFRVNHSWNFNGRKLEVKKVKDQMKTDETVRKLEAAGAQFEIE